MGSLRIEKDLEKLRAHARDIDALNEHLDLILHHRSSHIRERSDLVDVLMYASDEHIQRVIYRLMDVGSVRPEQELGLIMKGLTRRKRIIETTIQTRRRS